jgi:hypothetical protein
MILFMEICLIACGFALDEHTEFSSHGLFLSKSHRKIPIRNHAQHLITSKISLSLAPQWEFFHQLTSINQKHFNLFSI